MNVAFDPWIPVFNLQGNKEMISLSSALTHGTRYVDLSVRPHERVALMRLLLCVAHTALDGPKNLKEWEKVPETLPQAADAYLEKWKDSFELFHPTRPWLQVAGLSKDPNTPADLTNTKTWIPVSKLNVAYATGNASTIFDHEGLNGSREIPLEETILSMLTFQCFSPGGTIGMIYWHGVPIGKPIGKGLCSSKDGPCVPSSMIHAVLRGSTLLHSLQMNMPTKEAIQRHYAERSFGRPVWEAMPKSIDDLTIENATQTYTGRLVPLTRLFWLHPDAQCLMLGDGLIYPTFVDGFPAEPTATVIVRSVREKKTINLLPFRTNKEYWRELSAMVVKRAANGQGGPLSLDSLADSDNCDLVVCALARDQASILDTKESIYFIPNQMRTSVGISVYETEVAYSERIARRLGWAIETYRNEIDGGWEGRLKGAGASKGELKSKLHTIGTTYFWTAVENQLSLLTAHIAAIGTSEVEPTQKAWRSAAFSSACRAYELACGQAGPRHLRAYAKGWQKLVSINDEEIDETVIQKEEA
jgi:CRISPR system Cascade subunit CasA